MVTIFTTPKPFRDPHIAMIQANAIESWMRIGCEVIVFGDSEGTANLTARLGIRHVPEIAQNELGTPLVSALFSEAERLARHDLLCYANADILFTRDFVNVIRRLDEKPRSLMIGRRTDLDLREPVDFSVASWERGILDRVARAGKLHDQGGIDYFAFKRGLLGQLPPLAVGRGGWDMYMLYRARSRGADVVDATGVLLAVHQNHDYAHKPGGQQEVFFGPEGLRNVELAGGKDHLFDPRDATLRLTSSGFVRVRQPIRRRLRKAAILYPKIGWPIRMALSGLQTLMRRTVAWRPPGDV